MWTFPRQGERYRDNEVRRYLFGPVWIPVHRSLHREFLHAPLGRRDRTEAADAHRGEDRSLVCLRLKRYRNDILV